MRVATLLVFAVACASPPPPAAPVSPPPEAPVAETPKPAEVAAKVPPPPDACKAYSEPPLGCDPAFSLPEQLANALEEQESLTRDRKLSCVEPLAKDLVPVIRALRADLAPIACADAIVTPLLSAKDVTVSSDDEQTLLGLMLAGRLARLVDTPPNLEPPFDKPRFLEFFEHRLKPWMIGQALAIGQLSLEGAKLRGYGKAVAAVEAGLADLRFVQAVRKVPLPAELASDPSVRDVYYAALDEALEPRKARGRDAALVGLRLLFELGTLSDSRLERARRLLSELYGGSRLDALDALLLPDLPALHTDTVERKLAARLPTFYALRLLSNLNNPKDAKLLRAFGERGLPANFRARLDGTSLPPEVRLLYAELELRRGTIYFASTAFAHAAELAGSVPNDPTAEFAAAIGRALEAAPKDAAALMLTTPRLQASLGSLAPLSAIAAKKSRYSAEAEFDAAYLSALTPPENDPKFWRDLSTRYERAARALRSESARSRARDLAEAALKTAEAVQAAGASGSMSPANSNPSSTPTPQSNPNRAPGSGSSAPPTH